MTEDCVFCAIAAGRAQQADPSPARLRLGALASARRGAPRRDGAAARPA